MRRRSRRHRSWVTGVLVAILATAAADAVAQVRPARPTGIRVAREEALGGVLLLGGGPTGEFGDFVGANVGAGLYAVKHATPGSPLGFRFELSTAWYDYDGDWGLGFVNAGVGPQLTASRGPIRPYVFATGGVTLFAPIALVYDEYEGDVDPFLDLFNADVTLAAVVGGGLLLQISRGRIPMALDLSGVYLLNGEATYHTETNGRVRSDTNLWQIRVGLTVSVY